MATSSTDVTNFSNIETITVKKKYVKKRSKAYKKRRSIRRKKNNFYNSKRLLRYFVRKTRKLKMNNSIENTSEVQENTDRCSGSNEIGYWKSQVLSLQFENEMLCEYINELHSQLINNKTNIVYNENLLGNHQENRHEYVNDNDYENNEYDEYVEEDENNEFNKEGKQFRLEREEKKKEAKNERDDDPSGKPPEKPTVKKEEVMKKLYGKGWRKIMGMETVVQLNFDTIKDKQKINYWPIVPIKL